MTSALAVELDMEDFRQACFSRRCESQRAAPRNSLDPSKLQKTAQNGSANEALEVITTLGPVETGLTEHPPGTLSRPQVGAQRAQETLARGRQFASVIGQHDMSHRHKRVGDGNAHVAGQVIVATSGESERFIVG